MYMYFHLESMFLLSCIFNNLKIVLPMSNSENVLIYYVIVILFNVSLPDSFCYICCS